MKNQWLEIDKDGLRKSLGQKDKVFLLTEMVSNAWDEDITQVEVTLTCPDERGFSWEATEKEFNRQLKMGWVKFIHHGDKVPKSDCVFIGGVLRLKPLRELALPRCECGQPVFYQLENGDKACKTAYVTSSEQCWTCGRLQPVTMEAGAQ